MILALEILGICSLVTWFSFWISSKIGRFLHDCDEDIKKMVH